MTEKVLANPVKNASILTTFTKSAKMITANSRSNFSSSFIFLTQEKKEALQRVYAFFRVIDDVVDEEPDPLCQKELISFWKKELHNLYHGTTHIPLLIELKKTIQHFDIPMEYFLKLIEGCEMDITKKRYETFDELYEYCYRVASMVGLVCMKIFEYNSATSKQTAIELGMALQLTNIIRDVGVDLEKGRIYLPMEDLHQFGVSEQDILNKNQTENFIKLMDFEYHRAQGYYEKSFTEFAKDPTKKLLAAKIMGTVYREILEKIKRKNYPVFHQRIKLSFLKKIRILSSILVSYYV